MNDLERLRLILAAFARFASRQDPDLAMTTDYLLTLEPDMTNVDVSIIEGERLNHAYRVYFNDDCPVLIFAFFDDNDLLTHALASTDTNPYDLIFPMI